MPKAKCAYCELTTDLSLNDSADLRGVVTTLISHTLLHFGVHAADVLLYDAGAQKLVYAGGRGFRTNDYDKAVFRLENTVPGQVVQERRIMCIGNLAHAKNEFARAADLLDDKFISYVGAPLIINNQLKGVLEIFHREALNPSETWLAALAQIAEKGAIALGNTLLVRRLQRSNLELATAFDATIEGWSHALELRDAEPKGHTARVTEMTVEFARLIGIGEADLAHIRRGALLHDVGKMGIPDSILLKTETLTDDEWIIMRRHPLIAFEQLQTIEFMRPALMIPYCHHEMWDGSGYPQGLKGEQIPLFARLFALVDVWDSLRSDRPFRKAWPEEKVRAYITDRAGKHFDWQLADKFLKLLESGKRKQMDKDPEFHHTYLTTKFDI